MEKVSPTEVANDLDAAKSNNVEEISVANLGQPRSSLVSRLVPKTSFWLTVMVVLVATIDSTVLFPSPAVTWLNSHICRILATMALSWVHST